MKQLTVKFQRSKKLGGHRGLMEMEGNNVEHKKGDGDKSEGTHQEQ